MVLCNLLGTHIKKSQVAMLQKIEILEPIIERAWQRYRPYRDTTVQIGMLRPYRDATVQIGMPPSKQGSYVHIGVIPSKQGCQRPYRDANLKLVVLPSKQGCYRPNRDATVHIGMLTSKWWCYRPNRDATVEMQITTVNNDNNNTCVQYAISFTTEVLVYIDTLYEHD